MSGKTWFGTRGFETWVPTFAINPEYGRSGFSSRADTLEGGAGVRESKNAHNIYVISINPTRKRDEVRLFTDFADGVYDAQPGVNLVHFIDPMARDKNVLAQALATPSLACEDAPPWLTNADGTGRPTAVAMPANTTRYPARAAQYTQRADSILLEQYIPIPPGFSAWVGIHGNSGAAGRFGVQRVNGYTTVGSVVTPTVMDVTPDLVNTEFTSALSSGIVIKPVAVATPTTYTLYGLVVQILPTGTVPVPGMFISGQGHSGCQFVGKPSKTPYSAKLDMVGMTARLEETGLYL